MAAWLDLVREDEAWTVVDTRRLEELVQDMPYPNCQYPSLLFFAGNANRMRALRALFPQNNVARHGPAGTVRLHLSARTGRTEHPILFAESGLVCEKSLGDTRWLKFAMQRHQRHRLTIPADVAPARLRLEVVKHLILPWTQLLCLFVDSSADLKSAADLLTLPRGQLAVGGESLGGALRVVLVTEHAAPGDILEQATRWQLPHADQITVLGVRDRSQCSDTVAFAPLQSLLLDQLPGIWTAQQTEHRLFSASHLGAFWQLRLQHSVSIRDVPPFDLLAYARRDFPENSTMHGSLREGVRLMRAAGYTDGNIDGAVASALLMDAYPPEMHGRAHISLPSIWC